MYINDCSILGVFIVEILILKAILLFYLNMYNDRNYIITDSKNRKINFYLLTFNCIMILSHTKKSNFLLRKIVIKNRFKQN